MAAGAAPMPLKPSAASAGNASASAASGAIRMPNSAIDGIVCTTFSTPSTALRSRGWRWQSTPSGSATMTAAAERTQRQQQVSLRLVCKPRGVHGVLAHDRQVVEKARAECGERGSEEDGQRRNTQHGAGPQACQRVGGKQAERDQHDPEACPGRDAHDAIACGCQDVRRAMRPRRPVLQCR